MQGLTFSSNFSMGCAQIKDGDLSQTKMYFTFTFAFQLKKVLFNFDLEEPVTDLDQLCKGQASSPSPFFEAKLLWIKILKIKA